MMREKRLYHYHGKLRSARNHANSKIPDRQTSFLQRNSRRQQLTGLTFCHGSNWFGTHLLIMWPCTCFYTSREEKGRALSDSCGEGKILFQDVLYFQSLLPLLLHQKILFDPTWNVAVDPFKYVLQYWLNENSLGIKVDQFGSLRQGTANTKGHVCREKTVREPSSTSILQNRNISDGTS